jgi:uncharacterized protein YecT (DUF1311 family)
MKFSKIFIIALVLSSNLLYGASFDCAKASSKVEHLICGDHELSILDEHLAIAYRNAKKYEDPKRLKSEQREWIRRRGFCTTVACLQKSYTQRLKTLEDYAKGIQPKPWSGEFEMGTDMITIKPSKSFNYTSVGARGHTCEVKGKFRSVADNLEFHDDVNDCHLKITVISTQMLYLDATPCKHYCGLNAMASSGKFQRIAR